MVKPEFKPFPFVVKSAENFRVYSENKSIIDFSGSAMTTGYNFIKKNWIEPTVSRLVFSNVYTSQLTKMLIELSGFNNVAFSTSGTEACDAALYRFGRPIISLEGAYHGLTYLTNLVSNGTGYDEKNDILHLKVPNNSQDIDRIITSDEELLKHIKPRKNEGTLIMELIQSDGGVRVLPIEFIKYLFEVAQRLNLRVIVDEVYTGYGRSGELFLFKKYGIMPDMVCIGKGMAAGLPLGAVLYNGDWKLPINQVLTMQGGNMFTSRVAIEVLNALTQDRLEFVRKKGGEIIQMISSIKNSNIKSVRGLGFMIGVEFTDSHGNPLSDYAIMIRNELFENDVSCSLTGAYNNVLKITPPVLIDEATLDEGINKIVKVLSDEN